MQSDNAGVVRSPGGSSSPYTDGGRLVRLKVLLTAAELASLERAAAPSLEAGYRLAEHDGLLADFLACRLGMMVRELLELGRRGLETDRLAANGEIEVGRAP